MATKSPNISDEQILRLLQNQRNYQKGFQLLMHKYQERIYWHIRRLVIEHEDANDVVQNCFIKVFRNIHTFKKEAQLYTWLYRIATNEAITFLNKKNRKSTTSIDDNNDQLANQLRADPYFDGTEAQILLQEAVMTLPEKQKLVFNLRYFDELSYKELSDILGTSIGALKASFHHAVKKIENYVRQKHHL